MIGALAVTLTVLGSPVGRAPEAAFLDELARGAYAQGRFHEALTLFSEVQAAAPSTRNLYNMAVAAELGGRAELAFALWTRYLAAPDTDDEPPRRAHGRARLAALARGLALLTVETDPPGADIFVDRRALGRHGQSPLTLPVAPGTHEVFAERPGHRAARASVQVQRGQAETLRLRLEPRTGRIIVRARPAIGASVSRWAADSADPAPLPVGEMVTVPVGRWRLVAEAPGYTPAEIAVTVRAGELETRTLTLRRRPAPSGWLLVSAGAGRATLYVDGLERAEIPARIAVASGVRGIELRRDGVSVWSRQIEVEAGGSHVIWAQLP